MKTVIKFGRKDGKSWSNSHYPSLHKTAKTTETTNRCSLDTRQRTAWVPNRILLYQAFRRIHIFFPALNHISVLTHGSHNRFYYQISSLLLTLNILFGMSVHRFLNKFRVISLKLFLAFEINSKDNIYIHSTIYVVRFYSSSFRNLWGSLMIPSSQTLPSFWVIKVIL